MSSFLTPPSFVSEGQGWKEPGTRETLVLQLLAWSPETQCPQGWSPMLCRSLSLRLPSQDPSCVSAISWVTWKDQETKGWWGWLDALLGVAASQGSSPRSDLWLEVLQLVNRTPFFFCLLSQLPLSSRGNTPYFTFQVIPSSSSLDWYKQTIWLFCGNCHIGIQITDLSPNESLWIWHCGSAWLKWRRGGQESAAESSCKS